MRLTRKYLAALGIEQDKIDEIIETHMETVNALKAEIDEQKDKADEAGKLKEANKKLSDELSEIKEAVSKEDTYKVKYDALKEEFSEYKKGIESEKTKTSKLKAFKALLEDVGINTKRIDSVCKVSDIDGIELDNNGSIKDADSLKAKIKEEWEDFIVIKDTKGADTKTPPKNEGSGGAKTKDEILSIKDTSERQKAIAENHELFGI